MASSLGVFLNEDDLDEANRLSKKIDFFQLEEYEKDMIQNILEYNWDSENQMVSNLLHFPHIMPEDKRLKWLLKGLKEEKHSYYVLAAATGVAGLKLHGKDTEEIVELLKNISTSSQHGMVALRAFMSLVEYLKHPKDTSFVLKFMHKSKSNLRYNSLDWLLHNVKDKKELLLLLEDKSIPEGKTRSYRQGQVIDGQRRTRLGKRRPSSFYIRSKPGRIRGHANKGTNLVRAV